MKKQQTYNSALIQLLLFKSYIAHKLAVGLFWEKNMFANARRRTAIQQGQTQDMQVTSTPRVTFKGKQQD